MHQNSMCVCSCLFNSSRLLDRLLSNRTAGEPALVQCMQPMAAALFCFLTVVPPAEHNSAAGRDSLTSDVDAGICLIFFSTR